ncbi:MAG: tRNA (N6-isopentenyl adenosine(37)-C2)-methylthiotransferase MiaB [Thermogutta sp.]|nr:tRNA (N6-isopentenyl adenosine(37)-C2)-methylthiotransferase MiaB [Thermogutta sp.]HOP77158.1 tRNA (N6-isopentenyl adenosine(37)-C2)-methylthiotransferase MiaB [Thermogutta sp.]HPU05177.1 tRNA (N6-isopentenyl adenosine(37)-C2)-methylthiotransferase MiaB [Thermogutta sp.]HQF13906.1 tRNA (N6-isopentenyl adenosine(37)-C2)-methylthiotransferase MiaB [Thermogutta sp.]
MGKRFYIETVGCQMNELDSELVIAALLEAGYEYVPRRQDADIILFNTCSVRQHAEDKIYSALGRLKHLKEQKPGKIIGVLGCMAQKDQGLILKRAPHVDLVVGPGQVARLPELLQKLGESGSPIVEVSLDRRGVSQQRVRASFLPLDRKERPSVRVTPYQAYVRVMYGCDKFCTYCVVPRVRGPEQSRSPSEILDEVRQLADQGCLEITLLGQTVNSYHWTEGGKTWRLSDVLAEVHEVEGIRRIKFVTNYPCDMTPDLLQAVRDLPKVCPYLHVPAQSGSNRILQRMKRGYTVEEYREMLAAIRETIPGAAITSDFIVGFCGETEEDFAATVKLVEDTRFKNSFIFKYSPRPGTKAAELWPDDVPEEVKRDRNNELLAIQNRIAEEENRRFVGQVVEVLVEGPSKASGKQRQSDGSLQLTGRTACDRIVVFPGSSDLVGQFVSVKIEAVSAVTLFGHVLAAEAAVS